MKHLALTAAAALVAASFVLGGPAPARANAFCPVTIATVQSLAVVGRADTYGTLLDVDAGDVTSVRMRVDSATTRYAVDFDVAETAGTPTLPRVRRYFAMPPGERVVSAWIESTGKSPESRMECPITHPYAASAPAPIDPRVARALAADKNTVRDNYSTKTVLQQPKSFGPVTATTCSQPYAPPVLLAPIVTTLPPGARAVNAAGTTILRVDLDETSSVVLWDVVRSSGYAPLDRLAVAYAQKATYRTETFACRPVASSYQFAVTFSGGNL